MGQNKWLSCVTDRRRHAKKKIYYSIVYTWAQCLGTVYMYRKCIPITLAVTIVVKTLLCISFWRNNTISGTIIKF